MSSYIFNFRKIAVLTVAGVSSVLLLYHFAVVQHLVPPGDGYTNFKRNAVKIERMWLLPSCKRVFLGTSILGTCVSALPAPEEEDLALAGASLMDAIESLQQRQQLPPLVVVELSVGLRNTYKKLCSQALSPYRQFQLKLSPEFETQYQPVCVILNVMRAMRGRTDKVEDGRGSPWYAKRIEIMSDERKQIVKETLAAAARFEQFATERGVKVYYIKVPCDSRVENSAAEIEMDQYINAFLKTAKGKLLTTSARGPWTTTDGSHLCKADASRFMSAVLELPELHQQQGLRATDISPQAPTDMPR